MFDAYPSYDYNRTMELKTPRMHGEDVYALQTALNELGFNVGEADGILGPKTETGIRAAQRELLLKVDGRAGEATQKGIVIKIAYKVAESEEIPTEAIHGQIEWESANFKVGAYSELRDDGSYDAGITQRNTHYTSPKIGFDVRASCRTLGKEIRKHYDLFSGIQSPHRRWALAQGAWNAPAFACYIAREEGATLVKVGQTLRPSSYSRQKLEDYISKVSKYLI